MSTPRSEGSQPEHLQDVHRLRQLLTGGVTETACGLYGSTLVSTQNPERVTCWFCKG